MTRGTVWRRLLGLERTGFLKGYEVIPNPALLGVGLNSYNLSIPDARAQLRFLDALESVDGVLEAMVDLGPKAVVVTVADGPSSSSRREKMIARIDGVESMNRPVAVWLPDCTSNVSLERWRLISEFRRNPTSSWGTLARRLGVSPRTAANRCRSLQRGRHILGYLNENFEKFPGVVAGVVLTLNSGTESRAVAAAVQRLEPEALEIPSLTRSPRSQSPRLAFMRLVLRASDAQRGAAAFLGIPGVSRADTFFHGTMRFYRHWFDVRIIELLARHRATPR
ncbi:MAG: AsnC family transcriptional regulator [Thermoplasmata archaeon]|nr:AsnC family transcriptional regulator [Thermoplasmata archaeon]